MAENSNIEWTDHTFNPWSGCTKVSPACEHCYAEVNYSVKMRGVKWGKYGNRIIAADSMWKQPLAWNRKAEKEGVRKRVFCASLADVFEGPESMPDSAWPNVQKARRHLFLETIQNTPHLDWLLLTKRPENVMRLIREAIDPNHADNNWNECGDPNGLDVCDLSELYPNVWIGTTVENQKYANERIPHLLKIPAKIRFLSVEPMLGPVNLERLIYRDRCRYGNHSPSCAFMGRDEDCVIREHYRGIDWIICGGESGHKARPMQAEWVRSLREQCAAAGVPFFFKQWGEFRPIGDGSDEHATAPVRMGKKEAGRYLDGRYWDELPEVAHA